MSDMDMMIGTGALLSMSRVDTKKLKCPDFFLNKDVWEKLSITAKFFIMDEKDANSTLSD